ncbi:MAG: hypothetical protein ABIE22_00660 [archaeon]
MNKDYHVDQSLKHIQTKYPDLYSSRKAIVKALVMGLHVWLDEFDSKPPYTRLNTGCHREVRHHNQGFLEAVVKFVDEFDIEFEDIIREEAQRHIKEDMGKIPLKSDYENLTRGKRFILGITGRLPD